MLWGKAIVREFRSNLIPYGTKTARIGSTFAKPPPMENFFRGSHLSVLGPSVPVYVLSKVTRFPIESSGEVFAAGHEEVEMRATVFVQLDHADPSIEELVEDTPLGFCNGSIGLMPVHGAWQDQSQKATMVGAMIMDEACDVLAEANSRFVSAVWVP